MATYCVTTSDDDDWGKERFRYKTRAEADDRFRQMQATKPLLRLVRWEDNVPHEMLRHSAGPTAFTLELGLLRHDWLPVKAAFGEHQLSLDASLVMNNPHVELIDLAAFVHSGFTGFRRACFWLEPAGFALDVRDCTQSHVRIDCWSHPDFNPPMNRHEMNEEWSVCAERGPLYRALYLGLSRSLGDLDGSVGKEGRIQAHYDDVERRLMQLPKPEQT